MVLSALVERFSVSRMQDFSHSAFFEQNKILFMKINITKIKYKNIDQNIKKQGLKSRLVLRLLDYLSWYQDWNWYFDNSNS